MSISVFDPLSFPIRSCIRPIDELISNCGPSLRKHVSFDEKVVFIDNCLTTCAPQSMQSTPRTRRIRSNKKSPLLNPIESGLVFLDPYSIWDITCDTPIVLNNTKGLDRMTIKYQDAAIHEPKLNLFPLFSCLRKPNSRRKGLKVLFAFTQQDILPNGCVCESATAVEAPSDYWKPGVLDNSPIYKLNCNII